LWGCDELQEEASQAGQAAEADATASEPVRMSELAFFVVFAAAVIALIGSLGGFNKPPRR